MVAAPPAARQTEKAAGPNRENRNKRRSLHERRAARNRTRSRLLRMRVPSGPDAASETTSKFVPIRRKGAPSAPMVRRLRFGAQGGLFCRALRSSLFLLAASCLQIGLPDGADGGAPDAARGSDAGAPSDVKAADKDAAGDFGCVIDPLSRVTLCTAIGLCPGLSVDHDRFPSCGFRSGTGLIDVQCFCDDYLCPLGVATHVRSSARAPGDAVRADGVLAGERRSLRPAKCRSTDRDFVRQELRCGLRRRSRVPTPVRLLSAPASLAFSPSHGLSW